MRSKMLWIAALALPGLFACGGDYEEQEGLAATAPVPPALTLGEPPLAKEEQAHATAAPEREWALSAPLQGGPNDLPISGVGFGEDDGLELRIAVVAMGCGYWVTGETTAVIAGGNFSAQVPDALAGYGRLDS